MTWIVMALLLVISASLQTQLPGLILLAQAKVPILLCLTLYYALFRTPSTMLACAFTAGLLQDLLSPLPIGSSVACFCLAGAAISSFRGLLQSDAVVTQLFFGGVTGLLVEGALFAVVRQMGMVACPWTWALIKILGTGLLATLVAPIVCFAASACDRLVGNVRGDAGLEEGDHAYI
jgi:rod shape-determining protein MreD